MKKKILNSHVALLCILLMLLPVLAACSQKTDPIAGTSFASILIEKQKTVQATVTLSAVDADAHKGEKVYLYEVAPGDTLPKADASPIAEATVSSEMRFSFPLVTESANRLYSSFVVAYADGSLIFNTPRAIDNAEALANAEGALLLPEQQKGLAVDDPDLAAKDGVSHAMLHIDLAALAAGEDHAYTFSGKDYTASAAEINALDRAVSRSYAAGMQVSLTVTADADTLSMTERAALLELLTARYTTHKTGILSALYIKAPLLSRNDTASLVSIAYRALRSHTGTGDVYVFSPDTTLTGSVAFFSEIGKQLHARSQFAWGAAVTLDPDTLTWEMTESESITPYDLTTFTKALEKLDRAPRSIALCDIRISAEDTDTQAVALAFVYAKALEADFDRIFYGAQTNDAAGLYSASGEWREAAGFFRDIDSGLTESEKNLCMTHSQTVYDTLEQLKKTHVVRRGTGTLGEGTGKSAVLFDFASGENTAFTAIGAADAPAVNPQVIHSSTYNAPALYAWLSEQKSENGVRTILYDPSALSESTTLSIDLLTHYNTASTGRESVTLTLSGFTAAGKRLTLEASSPVASGTWQTVSFHINQFVTEADLSRPVVLSLTTARDQEATDPEPFGFWVKSIRTHKAQASFDFVWILVIICLCVLIVLVALLLFYRLTRRSQRPTLKRREN